MKLRHLFNNTCFGSAGLLISGMLCAPAQAVVFQAENYNYYYDSTTGNTGGAYRTDNVDIEKTLDTNGGFNLGWITANEWLTYSNLVIPSSGSYTINLRVASPTGARVALDLNAGSIYLGSVPISATNGWQNWKTVSFTTTIAAGTYQLGVYAETAGWNFNWIEVIPNGAVSSSKSSSSIKSSSSSKSSSAVKSSVASSTKSSSSASNNNGVPAGYNLVWQDEFDVAGLPSSTKWAYDTEANQTGWYNNEKQYYAAARLQNSEVKNGKLIITARKEALTSAADYGGQQYTSARLITNGKASWTYGHFEIRAKMPCGKGTWPAIWTLGTVNDPWPANGEIDIMEHVGMDPTTVHGTIWTPATESTWGDSKSIQIPDACSNFHNYQMTWTADKIVFAVDNTVYHTYYNTGSGIAAWPFNKPQYLLLNLAVGGDMGGAVDDSIFPRSFEIEHVRIYQKP
ncbi:family 16 glycosylhydrolase [Cellvibrio fibrivorans]|uniref:Beta-glucanase, GH16 family n=1 Tax=Cellvibrio fibrivorans TaxID=126350 RepID=A0ABU1UWW4_9GAMM|nr:family 16 glycosylhydrolase [Cellvibrio fibrivorans]MDR7089617.1 hypothetical protein [Cellvibrio fibrivorans]